MSRYALQGDCGAEFAAYFVQTSSVKYNIRNVSSLPPSPFQEFSAITPKPITKEAYKAGNTII